MSSWYRSWRPEEVATLAVMAPLGMKILRQELRGRTEVAIKRKARIERIVIPPRPIGNREGTRWRGKLAIPEHAHPAVRRIYVEANRQLVTLSEIATRAGVDRHLISGWAHRNEPKFSDLLAVLNALGLDLKIIQTDEDHHDDDRR